jgi:2-desacetyl-2-hydroxyethyl bacteriochlorophyllide A dehydrogenase
MKAALFNAPNELRITNIDLRKLSSKEVLIKVEVCGLCGTDFHIYKGEAPSKPPVIPGHEYVGIVADKGNGVKNLQIGDHVAIDPNIYCGECQYCRVGKINFCENLKALGVTLNGGFAEYSVVPSSQAYKIPQNFSLRDASFAEPLSCCVHGIDQAAIKHGEIVSIVGGGTIGLLMLQLAKMAGAGKVILFEPIAEKRNLALKIGADFVLNPKDENTLTEFFQLTNGGTDVVIECVGNTAAAELSCSLAKKGGRVVIFGLAGKNDMLSINLQNFFHKEITFKTSLLNPFTFSRSIELLVNNKIQIDKMKPVLSQLELLNQILSNPRNDSITKYQITPN